MSTENEESSGRTLELWMVSMFIGGMAIQAFAILLIPAFITSITGSGADAGIAMAVISLAAVIGPVLGGFADNYRAHRLVLSLGLLGMSVGFLLFPLSGDDEFVFMLAAILIGVGAAANFTLGPVFVLAAGLPRKLASRRLTATLVLAVLGQVVGGAVMGAAETAGFDFDQAFLLAAGIVFVGFLLTWFSSAGPAARIRVSANGEEAETERPAKSNLKQVLFSVFGLYLLILFLSSVSNNGINNQISNIMPNVYGMDPAAVAGLVSLAGVFTLLLFFAAGTWNARSGAYPVMMLGNILRMVGGLGMALLGLVTGSPVLLASLAMLVFYQGNPFHRLAQSPLGLRYARLSPSAANGWVGGSAALGSFAGSLLGGFLADAFGFNAINWMAAVAAGLAVGLLVVLWPTEKRIRAQEAADQ